MLFKLTKWCLHNGSRKAALSVPSSSPMTTSVTVAAGESVNVTQKFSLTGVNMWSIDAPHLYTASVSVTSQGTMDGTNVSFGVRTVSFDSTHGLLLNGKSVKLKGGCVHHDNGPLGAKTIDRSEERRVEVLKANGYNAIRTSHNPVSPAFVDACNRLGVVLMEEAFDCWEQGKNSDDYHLYFDDWWQRDIKSMVMRDRNAPSIIMWSIGNEIPMRQSPRGIQFSKELADWVRDLDPTAGHGRAVTSAYPGVHLDNVTDAFFAPLDVAGYNYGWTHYEPSHVRTPDRVIAGTESFPMQSYDTWKGVTDNSFVIGDFIWTAIDYIGESAIGGNGYNTPDLAACGGYCPQGFGWHISFCGDIDVVGLRKPQSYYRTVMWEVSNLELAVHEPVPAGSHEVVASWGWPDERQSWTWPVKAGTSFSINVYSRHPTVGLLLNGKPVGPPQNTSRYTATFAGVPYTTGTLTAVGYDANGKVAETKELATAGAPAALKLTPDRTKLRADRGDLSYVTVEVVDANGNLVPDAAFLVKFTSTGTGELAAVGSGDPADIGSFYQGTRTTYQGRAMAILRPGTASVLPTAGGSITLTATAAGLKPATATVVY